VVVKTFSDSSEASKHSQHGPDCGFAPVGKCLHSKAALAENGIDTSVPLKSKENPRSRLKDSLSERELQVLRLMVDGSSDQTIADKLDITLATTKSHVRNILSKMAVNNRTQAAVLAVRVGLV
jgi:DNA-binding NarL/FixJ family response regulator